MTPQKISKRKLKSYQRAEVIARELRYQLLTGTCNNLRLCDMVISWMKVTGKICYKRPYLK